MVGGGGSSVVGHDGSGDGGCTSAKTSWASQEAEEVVPRQGGVPRSPATPQ